VKFDEPLPKGWALTRCSDFCSGRNQTFNPAKAGDEEFILYSVPSHETGKPETVRASEIGSNKQFVSAGDTLISKINPRLNRTWVVGRHPGKKIIASTEWIVFGRSSAFIPEFLSYFLRQGAVRDFLSHNASGVGGSLTRIRASIFDEVSLPLPPLAEQKRIVAKIEELFSELEAGEESLRVARRQLGVYRQSLLKQAFEGHLTAKWRTHNPAKLEPWTSTTVGKIGRIETGTTPPTENQANYGGDLPFFKPTDLEQGRYVKSARSHLSEAGQKCARVLPAGSVLVTCIGATIGKTGLAQTACATNQQINSISPADDIAPEFAYFQVISPQFQDQIKTNASSTTLPILNKSKFSALPFVRCSLPEQQEIVRVLDEQFEVIERNERELDGALRKSEALRQAILQKAFTGRLVPQSPADEPASELLARLRAERAATPPSKRKSTLQP
jgi:type I restriction enzyme S subunit